MSVQENPRCDLIAKDDLKMFTFPGLCIIIAIDNKHVN